MATNKQTKAKKKGVRKKNDVTLEWLQEKYPQLADWRELCVSWLEGETRGVSVRLEALTAFFERYLVALGLPLAPGVFLARETSLPDFYKTACPPSAKGVQYNNLIHAFLEFVLLHHFSERDDDHRPSVSPGVPQSGAAAVHRRLA